MNINDKVSTVENVWDPKREEYAPTPMTGTIVAVHDARTLYPKRPQYSKNVTQRRLRKAEYKYGENEKVYVVQIDGEKHPRNFHEKQLKPCQTTLQTS